MRKIAGVLIVLAFVASAGFADENSEHLDHLRAMMHAMSQHGAVLPQPQAIQQQATVAIEIIAVSFDFSPSSFSVNQGDVVTLTVSVPRDDPSTVGHGVLMDTYVEDGMTARNGQSASKTFTATTPGTFAFVCTQPSCGGGHTSMIGQMIVRAVSNPGPTVTSIVPNTGPTGGGTAVTISGSNFQTSGTTLVRFDTTPATAITVVDSTTIRAVTPAHNEQTVGVRVTNPDGQTGTLPQAFTFADLKITSLSPNTGSTSGGTNVTISGSAFQNGATVTFGGVPATNVNVVDSNTIIATTPLGPATEQLAVDVVVRNPDGTSTTLSRGFTYSVPPLVVTSISPSVGVTGGGTVVTISGAGFTTALNSTVTFGGVAATNVTILSPVAMQVTAPAHGAGTVDVGVTVGGLTVVKLGAFTYQTAPPRRRAVRH